jgi:hypothetical protein
MKINPRGKNIDRGKNKNREKKNVDATQSNAVVIREV